MNLLKTKSFWKQITIVIIIMLISAALFLTLYKNDNKYYDNAPQAIGGILFISQNDMQMHPARYLWSGWNFYPDQLLTPQTVKDGKNMTNIQIGKYGNFSMGDTSRSIHGSGTYELTLVLPEEPTSYAIELPEIYSSYRFYINNRLMLEMGNPDANGYTEKIQNRTVVFEAAENVTLLIAASDNNHYYSGMVYPPSFGDVLHINTQRGIRMGLALSLTAITFLFALLALYIFWKTKRKNSLVFSILALSTAVMISYSCVHAIIPMTSQLWYTIELLSGYITILMIVILHNRICKTEYLSRSISTVAVVVFSFLILLYGALSTFLTAEIVAIFSYLIVIFKILTSAYLIIIAAKSIAKSGFGGKILFYCDIFFACSLIWDYILPAYEPILGGWFQEWGCLLLVGAMGAILWHDISAGYRHSLTFAEEQRQMQRQLDMQKEHYRQISNQIKESRRMRHDFRQHLRVILSMSERNEKVCKYIHEITSIGALIAPTSFCENHAVDALIRYYATVSKFENAIEASGRLIDKQKKITVKGKLDTSAFYFVVQNNFDNIVIKKDNKFISRKHNGFGIGFESIKEVVKRHNGMLEVESEHGVFKASVVLPYYE